MKRAARGGFYASLLIDTGSARTFISNEALATKLALLPINRTPVVGINGGQEFYDEYVIALYTLNSSGGADPWITELRVLATNANLASRGIDGLLGRDVLARCQLTYDGRKRVVSLDV